MKTKNTVIKENKTTPAVNYDLVLTHQEESLLFSRTISVLIFTGHTMCFVCIVSGRNSVKVNKPEQAILEISEYNPPRQTSNLVNASLAIRQPLYGRTLPVFGLKNRKIWGGGRTICF